MRLSSTPRLSCAIALALVMIGAPRTGRARTLIVTTRLDYAATPGCPPVASFAAVVAGRLGHDPFRPDAGDKVLVRIEPNGRALEGRIEWQDRQGGSIGQQTFPSRTGDCAELVRAMGFALALQLQLMAATVENSGPPRPAAPPPPARVVTVPPAAPPAAPPVAPRVTAPPTDTASVRRHGPSVLIGAGVSAGLGLSSEVGAVGRLLAALGWSHVAVELAAEASAPATTHRAGGGGFSQQELLVSLAGCGVLAPWSACAVGKIGDLRVVGQGVDVPLTASGLMIQTGLRLAASHTFGHRTYLIAHADGLGRLTQGTVTLDAMPVWTTPRFVALLGLDVAFRFR